MTQNMVPPTVASGSGSFLAVFAGKIIETETERQRETRTDIIIEKDRDTRRYREE